MNEDVKGANTVEEGEKSDGGRDLADDVTDLLLDNLLVLGRGLEDGNGIKTSF